MNYECRILRLFTWKPSSTVRLSQRDAKECVLIVRRQKTYRKVIDISRDSLNDGQFSIFFGHYQNCWKKFHIFWCCIGQTLSDCFFLNYFLFYDKLCSSSTSFSCFLLLTAFIHNMVLFKLMKIIIIANDKNDDSNCLTAIKLDSSLF